MALPSKTSGQACAAEDLPANMKAVTRRSAGVFAFDENFATPALTSPKELLVEIKAAAINPVDYKVGKMLLGPRVGLEEGGLDGGRLGAEGRGRPRSGPR